ncbi:MAG TPA: DUF3795 domain-containing protein, partial [Terriglobales bacterium]|nr:DUF3795 domain-containing protein [Terriglobales bacterium]
SQLDIFLTILSKNEIHQTMAKHLGEEENKFGQNFEAFKKLPEFFNVLDSIIKIQCNKTCRESGGCSLGGITRECEAVKCTKIKGYKGCWECSDYKTCDKLTFQKLSYGETIEGNLELINKEGIESVKSRGNLYYEWQRKLMKLKN